VYLADDFPMDCPSCNNKAKEQGPDRIICGTCGDLSRVGGEWIPTEAGPPEVIPVEETPSPEDPPPDPPENGGVMVRVETDDDWLTRFDLGVGS